MTSKLEHPTKVAKLDGLLWLLVVVLLGAALVTDIYFKSYSWAWRLLLWPVVALVVIWLGQYTSQGRRLRTFMQEAQAELRRVVWPTRRETLRTTLMVVVVVTITGFFLWSVDSILFWLVAFFTGYRG